MDSEALIMLAASGDAAAFRSLLDRHYDRVFRVVYSVVRNQSDAEDITQDIWAAMPKKLRHWRGEAKVTSWLHRIALNAAKDALRKSATRARATAGYAEVEDLSRGEAADTERRPNEFCRSGRCSRRGRRHSRLADERNQAQIKNDGVQRQWIR